MPLSCGLRSREGNFQLLLDAHLFPSDPSVPASEPKGEGEERLPCLTHRPNCGGEPSHRGGASPARWRPKAAGGAAPCCSQTGPLFPCQVWLLAQEIASTRGSFLGLSALLFLHYDLRALLLGQTCTQRSGPLGKDAGTFPLLPLNLFSLKAPSVRGRDAVMTGQKTIKLLRCEIL